jgi:hypothetical protein
MHEINQQPVSPEFIKCWQAAGLHIQNQSQGALKSWIRADFNPPFLEHFSFRLGNQLFFIQLTDQDNNLEIPGNLGGLKRIAKDSNGFACLMPMRKKDGEWVAVENGWGLVDLKTNKVINPLDFVSDELIEMTDWELHDFAIQIVRDNLKKEGKTITGWNGDPEIQPSIWFENGNTLEWIIVKFSRWPNDKPEMPKNISVIANEITKISGLSNGNFASMSIANANDPFDPSAKKNGNFMLLYRGHGLMTKYEGLISLTD